MAQWVHFLMWNHNNGLSSDPWYPWKNAGFDSVHMQHFPVLGKQREEDPEYMPASQPNYKFKIQWETLISNFKKGVNKACTNRYEQEMLKPVVVTYFLKCLCMNRHL